MRFHVSLADHLDNPALMMREGDLGRRESALLGVAFKTRDCSKCPLRRGPVLYRRWLQLVCCKNPALEAPRTDSPRPRILTLCAHTRNKPRCRSGISGSLPSNSCSAVTKQVVSQWLATDGTSRTRKRSPDSMTSN